MNFVILGLTLLSLSSISLAIISVSAFLMVFGRLSRRWPSVTGTIVSSTFHTGLTGSGITAYWVTVEYLYTVGTELRGSWIAFARPGAKSFTTTSREKAKLLYSQVVPGTTLPVYYWPRRPTFAVLFPGPHREAMAWLLLFPPFAFLPIWLGWLAWAG